MHLDYKEIKKLLKRIVPSMDWSGSMVSSGFNNCRELILENIKKELKKLKNEK